VDEAKIKKELTNFSFVLFVCLLQCGAAKNLFVLIFYRHLMSQIQKVCVVVGGFSYELAIS